MLLLVLLISFLLIYTDVCLLALYTQYLPEFCEKNHRHYTRVGLIFYYFYFIIVVLES